MQEIIINLHMHTRFSDGTGSHADIARAGIAVGLDAVIVTDHNVWVNGMEGYFKEGRKRILVLIGEEIHDQDREPQKNHLLVFGAGRELATFADNPQELVDQVVKSNGLAFIAHPIDPEQPALDQEDLSWENWEIKGITGIELWNGFSEFKVVATSKIHAIFYAYFPHYIAHGPIPGTLQIWDELLAAGKKIVAIGGSDAHAMDGRMGPLRRIVFPYEFHFSAVNTHLFLPRPLSGEAIEDRRLILDALAAGHAFVANDLPNPARGFRFTAQGKDKTAIMGDEIDSEGGVTLQVKLPSQADIRLIKDGQEIKTWTNREVVSHITTEPGVFRIEAYKFFYGKRRGWIFSNPIYVR